MRLESLLLRQVVCDGFRFTYMTSFYASVMAVFLVTIDRLIATQCVLRYRLLVSKDRIKIVLILAWIYIVTLCSLPFENDNHEQYSELQQSNQSNSVNFTMTHAATFHCHYKQSHKWTIGMLATNCALPYSLIIVFYCKILMQIKHIQHRTERSRTCTSTSLVSTVSISQYERKQANRDIEEQHLHKLTRTSVITALTYLLLWLPSVVYYVMLRACTGYFPLDWEGSNDEIYVGFFTKFLAFLDAVAAPIIYCAMSGEFRKRVPCKHDTCPRRKCFHDTNKAKHRLLTQM